MWSELSPPTARAYHATIYDPVGDRMLLFGGFDIGPRNDTWTLSLSDEAVWRKLAPSGTAPPARYGHVAIHDPVRNRMVIFGGFGGGRLNDTWALSTQTLSWTPLVPADGIGPSPRQWASAIYDPVRDRIVLFGGSDLGGERNDVWAMSLSGPPAWTEIVPAGTLPEGRHLHGATYDAARDRMLVFGGIDGVGSRNDTWALSLSGSPTWSEIPAPGPPGRSAASMIHDPARDRVLVFGGFGGSGDDVWELTLAGAPAWTQLTPAGSAPSPRVYHTAIYDADDDRMVVFAGLALAGGNRDDSWALSLSGSPTWTELDGSGAPIRQSRPSAIYDPVRDRMVVSRGGDGLTGPNEVWALSLSGQPDWNAIAATGSGPYPRPTFGGSYDEYVSIFDPVRDRMVVFGGNNDVWALSLSGSPAWTQLSPQGDPPTGRSGHSAIYDPVADRMVIFGGASPSGGFLRDAWGLSLSGPPVWTALAPITSAPPGRAWHSTIYDPQRHRLVVFGGWSGSYQSDVWALTLAEPPVWSQLVPSSPGIGRDRHSAIYDAVRDRMVVFGGGGPSGWRNDVLALSLTDAVWTVLTPSADPPSGRSGHAAIYDPLRDRMVIFGGRDLAIYRSDAWSLGWATPPTLSLSLSPSLLWPPNHKLVDIHATVSASDGDPEIALVSVTSDEPDSGMGGGDVPLDIQGVAVGTPDFDFQLRAERDESGDGRTYTVCYEARSASGVASQCEVVTVPHQRRGRASVVASAGALILTCRGSGAMPARSIVAGSVGVATEDFGRTRAATGPPEFWDEDGDGIEDARFVFAPEQGQDAIAFGDVRLAYWQAEGQVYLANIPDGITGVPEDGSAALFEARPMSNPARGRASIRYALPHAGHVRVGIYDAMGRQVSRPVDGWRPAGWHTVAVEGGSSSQVYLYRIEWEAKSLIGKVAVLR